jgi:hypothetical protein
MDLLVLVCIEVWALQCLKLRPHDIRSGAD